MLDGANGRFIGFAVSFNGASPGVLLRKLILMRPSIVLLSGGRPLSPDQVTPLQALLGLVALPVMVWKLVVDAHILRHSLNVPFFGGLALAVLWIIAELALGAVLHAPVQGA